MANLLLRHLALALAHVGCGDRVLWLVHAMRPTQPSRRLFDQFVMGGIERIERCRGEAEHEGLHLDFKTSSTANGRMTADDQSHLSKNLSAFANSEGGVLVWGVDAKGTKDDQEKRAVGLKPIPNVERFHEDLLSYEAMHVVPAVSGVEHTIVPLADGSGYAVTYVPRSQGRPHQAKDKRYYQRAGSQTLALEHGLVRALFLVAKEPALAFHWNVQPWRPDPTAPGGFSYVVNVYLGNDGDAPADGCAVALAIHDSHLLRIGRSFVELHDAMVQFEEGVINEQRVATERLLVLPKGTPVFPNTSIYAAHLVLHADGPCETAVAFRLMSERSSTYGSLVVYEDGQSVVVYEDNLEGA